jgi:hypothetical protein
LTSTRAAGSQARVRCRNSHGVRFESEVPLGNPGLSTSTARVVQFPVTQALSDGFFARRLRRFEVVKNLADRPVRAALRTRRVARTLRLSLRRGGYRDRTGDIQLAKLALSQLS